jgi:hypothetical protein
LLVLDLRLTAALCRQLAAELAGADFPVFTYLVFLLAVGLLLTLTYCWAAARGELAAGAE